MRSNTTERSYWSQFGIGACALVLPPLTLGAAFYSMLASPDEGAERPAAAVTGAPAVHPETKHEAAQPWAISADPQPATRDTQPIAIAAKPVPPQDTARASDSLPVQSTAALAGVNPALPGDTDSAPRAALGGEPSQSVPPEVSTALLPRALLPPGQIPLQVPPPQMLIPRKPAVQAPPAADQSSAEGPRAPSLTARKHGRPSYLANLAGHNGARPEARSETPATRRNVQPPPQQEFSLKNWLQQQLGIRPHSTRG
jgi:hypothetical protein